MVLMSAWMPAPPLESLPAMVNAVFIVVMEKLPFCSRSALSSKSWAVIGQ
jgi:hypothetical protein